MEPINILERIVNGKMIQSLPYDFLSNKGRSHVVTAEHHLADETIELRANHLKATLDTLGPRALCTGSSPPFGVPPERCPVWGIPIFEK